MMIINVIIPIHNGLGTLERSLNSVYAQDINPKNFGLEKINVICVLNAMNDVNEEKHENLIFEISKEKPDFFKTQICYEKEKGIVPALNCGIASVSNRFIDDFDFIARQDADDLWYPNKLSKQLEFFYNNPDIDVVGTNIRIVNTDLQGIEFANYPETDREIKEWMIDARNPIAHPSVMFRTKILKRLGGYSDLYPMAEDFDMWFRARKWYKFANVQEVLVDYTFNPNPNYDSKSPYILTQNMISTLRYFGQVSL